MNDIDTLNAALDAEPWLTLRAVADALEERGEAWLARGYRYLAVNRLQPVERITERWSWPHGYNAGFHTLPVEAQGVLRRAAGVIGCDWNERRTCSEAFRAGAEAVATMLQEIDARLPKEVP